MTEGPPPAAVLSLRPLLLALLITQTLLCVLQIVMLLDILGGFISSIAIGLGWYAWNQCMDLRFLVYYAMFSLFRGALDLVSLIDALVKSGAPLFKSELGAKYNIDSAIRLLS